MARNPDEPRDSTQSPGPSGIGRDPDPIAPPSETEWPTEPVGRGREIEQLKAVLEDPEAQLITLTGPGGVGMTRLAWWVARAWERAGDGRRIIAVPLAAVRDRREAEAKIAQALAIEDLEHPAEIERLRTRLGDDTVLLVVDNFEHLLDTAPRLAALVVACPQLKAIVTSRAPLRVTGERPFPLPPLDLPPSAIGLSVRKISRSPAVGLFVQRMVRDGREFKLTAANASVIVEICRLADGLPLAIELAAERSALQSPKNVLDLMQLSVLGALCQGPRDADPRQQTLRNSIAWSYRLLRPREKALFRRLSVCGGSCTLDQAKATWHRDITKSSRFRPGAGGVRSESSGCFVESLEALQDFGFIQIVPSPTGEQWIKMRRMMHEFGLEQDAGDRKGIIASRLVGAWKHVDCLSRLVRKSYRALGLPRDERTANEVRSDSRERTSDDVTRSDHLPSQEHACHEGRAVAASPTSAGRGDKTKKSGPDGPAILTDREIAVLRLIAEGRTNAEIGQELFISRRTVNAHIRSINSKLGVKDRNTAVALAREAARI